MKYVARFFDRMDNHILEGTYPNVFPKFTPREAAAVAASAAAAAESAAVEAGKAGEAEKRRRGQQRQPT